MIAHVIPAKRGTLRLAYFDYLVPAELEETLRPGHLITIPLRNRVEFGVVLALSASSETNKLKTVLSIVVPTPLISEEQLAFLQEMNELYHVSFGFLLKSNLLPIQKRKITALAKSEMPVIPTRTKHITKPKCHVYTSEAAKEKYLSEVIDPATQTLLLVPEVNDCAPLQTMIEKMHPGKSCLVTSGLSEKELFEVWIAIWRGEKTIIIGTRGAIFLPFNNLGNIILDNEGHEGHKSWDMAPRFLAREAAFFLGKHHGATVHLLSHTPSVDTYYFAKHNVYETVVFELKPFEHKNYSLFDIRAERRAGHDSHVGGDILEALQSGTGSAFLLCHRRGTMSYVSCRDCKHVLICPTCKHSLTYHQPTNDARCHHCGYGEPMRATCQKCGGMNLSLFGVGTDYVVNELKKQLPDEKRPIIAIDQDTDLTTLPTGDCIIVGTQFAWRHITWEKLSVVGIIDADTPLFVPEYRTVERLFLQMRDILYRLPDHAKLYIQTNHPEHPVFASLAEPDLLYLQEISQRKLLKYPPFRYLLKLAFGHEEEAVVKTEMAKAYKAIQQLTKADPDCTITSPYMLLPYQQRGQYWQGMLVKLPFSSYKKYWKAISTLLPDAWKVDPNPLTIFSL